MKILLVGWFGAGNMGDEAILISELLLLRKEIGNVEFHVLSFGPERTRRLVADIPEVRKIIRMGAKRNVVRSDLQGLLRSLREVDFVIIGGGGLFQDIYNFYPIPFFTFMTLLARLLKKPPIFYCLGIGPIRTFAGRALCRLAANSAHLISVRDRESADLLRNLGITRVISISADPVFMLEPSSGKEVKPFPSMLHLGGRDKIIGVCVQDLLYWSDANRRALAGGLDAAAARWNVKTVFLPFGAYQDRWFSRKSSRAVDVAASQKVADLMRTEAKILDTDAWKPQELLAEMAGMRLVISMRLHGLIMAMTAGTPVVALTYRTESKIQNLMRALGQEDRVFEVSRLEKQGLLERIDEALIMRDEARQKLKEQVARLRIAAEAYTSSLAQTLMKDASSRVCRKQRELAAE